jgi:fatty acid desaturase
VLSGIPYWIGQARVLWRNATGRAEEPWIPDALRASVIRESRIYLALYAGLATLSIALASPLALYLWAIPVILGQPVLRAFLMAEHTGLPFTDDPFANTRTTLAGRAVALLFWNANLHAEHHLAPGVPFFALPMLHDMVRAKLRAVEPDYRSSHRTIRARLS